MLEAKTNRLDYGLQLRPPLGYELDHAITTTYSLDLEAILLIPVALFFGQDMDISRLDVRADMLEALTKASKQISIYFQRGKIRVPSTYHNIIAYWEKGIIPIQMEHYAQSFHPKVWIIRYIALNKKDPVKYRFINTSRNLTFSRDWDLAFTTDGELSQEIQNGNQGLIDLLAFLAKAGKKSIPDVFFKELPFVSFEVPSKFNTLQFHPIGILMNNSLQNYTNPLMMPSRKKSDSRLVMSPFLDETTLKAHIELTKDLFLFSSQSELSGIRPVFLNSIEKKYMFSPFIEDAESRDDLSEPDTIPVNQNLHAKFFIDKNGGKVSWFIGSANATMPANGRNVEFMVELTSNSGYLFSPEKMADQFTAKDGSRAVLFEPFEHEDVRDIEIECKKEQLIRKLIYELSSINFTGSADKQENNSYDISINIPKTKIKVPELFSVRLKPLPEKGRKAVEINLSAGNHITDFKSFQEIDLSPFLIFEIWEGNNLLKQFILDMKINLDDSRLRKIFSSIINNRAKFLQYLSFLLAGEVPGLLNSKENQDYSSNNGKSKNGLSGLFLQGSPVYEKLLMAASRHPEKLINIKKLMEKLKEEKDENGNPIVSVEFNELWNVFKEVISKWKK